VAGRGSDERDFIVGQQGLELFESDLAQAGSLGIDDLAGPRRSVRWRASSGEDRWAMLSMEAMRAAMES
jgi:hypothetical protein